MTIAGNNGVSWVTMFVYFRWNVESTWFGISLYEKSFSFVVNEAICVQSFNIEFYTCLDVTSNVNVKASVELSIVKLS